MHPKNSRVHLFLGDFCETQPANCRSDVAEERQDPTSEKLMFNVHPDFIQRVEDQDQHKGEAMELDPQSLTLEFSANDLNDHVPFIRE